MRGKLDYKLRDLHEQYGDVVRSAPQILSFTAASAWKDIYGYGHRELPKGIVQGSGFDEDQLIAAPGASHARMRRAMGPAFSDKALGQQEAVIMEYVDLLVQRLHETSRSGKPTDMVQWYNFTTFDAIADLAYGKSLGGLSEGTTNEWIKNIRRLFQVFPLILIAMQFPLLSIILKIHAGSKIRNAQASHKKYCTEMTMERIHRKGQPDRGDFMDYMMRSQDEKSRMSQTELVANSDLLMIAGSETTATLLSGITFWLLKTPGALKRVVEEVRSEFESDADITFRTATDKLPYMLACLDECLRIYPPVPSAFVRHCPPGAPTPICGLQVPAGTRVSVQQFAAYHLERNFHRAEEFIPERWLPESTEDPASPFYNDQRAVHKPFSYGPRDCIGRILAYHEMRLVLAKVLWNFDMELAEDSRDWNQQRIIVSWEKPPLKVTLKPRNE
ncbi:MAG: hypothetical protein LQ340_000781 [Diploschistes diacapsis]|nr:MAG: hypothetical protein LQ340_000781 [Diploschistes diacapsis]